VHAVRQGTRPGDMLHPFAGCDGRIAFTDCASWTVESRILDAWWDERVLCRRRSGTMLLPGMGTGDNPAGGTQTDRFGPQSPPRTTPGSAELIGTRLGHFRVEERLGNGGMGIVYRAFDEKLHRAVAIKVVAGHVDRRGARLFREARLVARLAHPGIAAIYE